MLYLGGLKSSSHVIAYDKRALFIGYRDRCDITSTISLPIERINANKHSMFCCKPFQFSVESGVCNNLNKVMLKLTNHLLFP